MRFARYIPSLYALLFLAPLTIAQSADDTTQLLQRAAAGCGESPREDALVSTCAPPSMEKEEVVEVTAPSKAQIALAIPSGTPLRIAVDRRVRIKNAGETVSGKVVETVYAFDQPVIPAGSIATGRVKSIDPVPAFKRTLAYANGNFTPFHQYEITFDNVTLPDGTRLPIKTTVSAGSPDVVHLVSNPEKAKQKGAAERATDKAKAKAKGSIAEAKDQAHEGWQQLTRPGKMHRLRGLLLAQSPYRRQYLEPGTRFVADLDAPLDFGATTRNSEQLAVLGREPAPDSTLKARLVSEVSSATATRGTPVTAILTAPLYSPTQQLILPAGSRLVGEVLAAKPARKLHRNGELRVVFQRIETSEEGMQALTQIQEQADRAEQAKSQSMVGNLEGVEVDRSSNMKLDEEGGARTTDSKSRYLSSGLAVLLAAAASHTEMERGTTEVAGPGVRGAVGISGARLTGALISLAGKSMPVSVALGAYGASTSIYANFLSRGHDVVFPKDTPMEISFGPPHAPTTEAKAAQ